MYICVIVSTVDVNDCIFCVNEQQKVYYRSFRALCPRTCGVDKKEIKFQWTGFEPKPSDL